MFLKTLTIKGFKSFADSTTLTMEPGVTVVVGPNGSGKSNVVDAIGWVLGAQAPSAVRSAKMDDVIFAGTAKRAALGRAEVSLTIDNTSGLLPIEFTEVTITRTLFRSGDSEYAINGVPCRLLDVQELLSDSGMGRQQHVIISQGQIDAVLNARPEDRRLIIEEAAGVLKYRRRKEKAERRLSATEANFTRLEDLLREVRRQLRPLEKQADAARRHHGLAEELHALKVYLTGRDLVRLRQRLADNEARTKQLSQAEYATRMTLANLDTQVLSAEASLISGGVRELSEGIGQCESLREKARGQRALIAERRRRIELLRTTLMDQGVVASLAGESVDLQSAMSDVTRELSTLHPELEALQSELSVLELAETNLTSQEREEDPRPRAAKVRGELAAIDAAGERATAELGRLELRRSAITERLHRLASELADLEAATQEAEGVVPGLHARAEAASVDREEKDVALVAADTRARDATAEHAAWSARVETLESALDAARAKAGIARLADVAGVVGTLLDVVEVDEGYGAAFEVGAGEAVGAVVLADVDRARQALDHLRKSDAEGSVLAAGQSRERNVVEPRTFPGMVRLRDHVRSSHPGVTALLDLLVAQTFVAESWSHALDFVLEHPDVVIVTRGGDRFGPSGWRVTKTGAGANAGALDAARAQREAASEAEKAALEGAQEARSALATAQTEAKLAQEAFQRATQAAATTRVRLDRTLTDHVDTMAEADALDELIAQLGDGPSLEARRRDELVAELAVLDEQVAQVAKSEQERTTHQQSLKSQRDALEAERSKLQMREAGLNERLGVLQSRANEVNERLARDQVEREEAGARQEIHQRTLRALQALDAIVEQRSDTLSSAIGSLTQRRRELDAQFQARNANLERLRQARSENEATLEKHREDLQQIGLTSAEVRVRAEQIVATLRSELDVNPESAIEALCPEIDGEMTPVARVRDLERELRAMGTINPLALAEFEAMRERHEFLGAQLEDVKVSRRDLMKVIRGVDAEIASTFAAAYADVRENFIKLFAMLFPGGTGDLLLTEPDDPLNTGIEIKAKPSGKNVRKLSLLSGGERSLVALAYLFAVFRSRSSPFYVMDEVEAALDDVNLHRFLDLVAEFRSQAQLIIVSHQKRTMEAADTLYGVTMQPGGSSKVISEKV